MGALSEPGLIVPVVEVEAVVVVVDTTAGVVVVVDATVDVVVAVDVVVVVGADVVVVVVVALPQDDNKIAVTSTQLNTNHAILLRISSLLLLFFYPNF